MMIIEDLLPLSRRALRAALHAARGPGPSPALALDCTAGNGLDTLFLAREVGPGGRVWAFDVQESAIERSAARLREAGLADRATLIPAGHEDLSALLPLELRGRIAAAVFNLGFLPGSDRSVITRPETTLAALQALREWLAPGGLVSLHSYAGHKGGEEERVRVHEWFAALPWNEWRAASYGFVNKAGNRETLYLASRN